MCRSTVHAAGVQCTCSLGGQIPGLVGLLGRTGAGSSAACAGREAPCNGSLWLFSRRNKESLLLGWRQVSQSVACRARHIFLLVSRLRAIKL